MPDMLVKLYELPDPEPELARLLEEGIRIRRAMLPERQLIVEWVSKEFRPRWGDQCAQTFSTHPPTCFIAVREEAILGFALYDAVFRGVFGPTGVLESHRGRGIGKVLLQVALAAMHEDGYIYGVIGRVGPEDFYTRHAGAILIEGSDPGMYTDLLR